MKTRSDPPGVLHKNPWRMMLILPGAAETIVMFPYMLPAIAWLIVSDGDADQVNKFFLKQALVGLLVLVGNQSNP